MLIRNFAFFSVRLNERKVKGPENLKKMAYLVDLKTICVGMLIHVQIVIRGIHVPFKKISVNLLLHVRQSKRPSPLRLRVSLILLANSQ